MTDHPTTNVLTREQVERELLSLPSNYHFIIYAVLAHDAALRAKLEGA